MNAKIIKTETTENGKSFLIQFNKKMSLWLDSWEIDSETNIDWNKYIFYTNDAKDQEIKEFQENPENFEIAIDLIYNFLSKNE